MDWTITSLTKDSDGNIVATLFQATSSTDTSKYSLWDPTNSTANLAYPANMYSTSYIRNVTLNAKGCGYVPNDTEGHKTNPTLTGANTQSETNKFAKFTMEDIEGSLTNYIVTPAKIKYQETQNHYLLNTSICYSNPNGAWGIPEGTFKMYTNGFNVNYLPVPGYTANTKQYYAQWKDDYVWLPSMTEWSSNIKAPWAMTTNQKQSANVIWQRCGNIGNNGSISCVAKSGDMETTSHKASESLNYRAALHLNLTKAEEDSLYLCSTNDVSVNYNGQVQSLETLTDWYNDDWVESIVYKNSQGEVVTDFKDAGSYEAEVTLKSLEERPNVGFYGKEITSRTHTYMFTINKKKIAVSLTTDDDGYISVAEKSIDDIYTDDLVEGRRPKFCAVYDSSDGAGYHFDDTTTPTKPNKVGSYLVTAKIINECNYEIDTSKPYTTNFTKNKTNITRPNIQTKKLEYNGTEQEFPLMGGMNLTDIKVVPISSGVTYDATTGVLKAKKAGKYTVRIALADNTQTKWSDGDNRDDPFNIEIEITKKFLNLTVTTDNKDDENNISWSWKASQTPKVIITGDSYVGDRTELKIYYYNTKDPTIKYDDINDNKQFSDDFKTRTITMPKLEPGVYVIGIEIFGNSFTNDCYQIAENVKTQSFTVTGNDITLEHPIWKCNGNTILDNNNIKFTYTGSAFNFTVDEEDLKTHGMEIDLSQGINGFTGSVSVTDAGTYSITVHLKSLPNFELKTATHMINYTIEKAKYDLSGLSWNYGENNKRYFIAGTEQSVILSGSLPVGLTARYAQNKGISVSSYNASVTFVNSNTKNFITPNKDDTNSYTGNFSWTLSWQIEKAILTAEWNLDSAIPKLKPHGNISLHDMVTYTYYETDASYSEESKTLVSASDIGKDNSKEQFYIVEANLTTANAQNYILDPSTPTQTFSVGSDKYVIQLKVLINNEPLKASYPYSVAGFNVDFEITLNPSGVRKEDIVITYYSGDDDTTGSTEIPTSVGKYHAVITIKDNPSSVVGSTCDNFDFEIVKANFDVSQLKWQYTHNDIVATYDFTQSKWVDSNGQEIINIKFDGLDHIIELVGLDNFDNALMANITAINAGGQVDVNSNNQLVFLNAGSNDLYVNFLYDSSCYNKPNFAETICFNIAKANIDTSKIVWGYVINNGSTEMPYTGQPLEYGRVKILDGSTAINYTLKLINVPEELKNCINYTGNITESKASITTSYQVSYTIDYSKFNTNNFETCSMPAGLRTKLDWKIAPKYIDIPVYDNSWTIFDDQIHSFATMCGLIEDWQLYFDITITKDGVTYAGLDANKFEDEEDRQFKAYDAGKYILKFSLKNSGTDFYWKERFSDIEISAEKVIINIERWSRYGVTAEVVTDNEDFSYFTEYVFKDVNGNIMDVNDVIGAVNADITKTILVKEEFEGNVVLNGETSHNFKTGEGGRTFVEKPTMPTDIIYTGEEINIEEILIKFAGEYGFKPALMEISGDIIATKAGTYNISIFLIDMNLYRWLGEDADVDEIKLTWTIGKVKIVGAWQNKDGYQVFVPNNPEDADMFSVIYIDKDGNEVSISNMIKGETYTAKVILNTEGAEESVEFVGADDVTISTSKQFSYSLNDSNNNAGFLSSALAFLTDNWLYVVIALITLILLILIFVFIKRRKNKKQENSKNEKLEKEKEELQKKLDEANSRNNSSYPSMPYPMPPYYPPMPPQYPSSYDSNLTRQIEELRDQVKTLTKYNLASDEEKSQNNRLAMVENMLMQFLMNNFANNPNWIPFNNQDMVNYDINDLMKIYAKAKQAVSNNNARNQKGKQRIMIDEEAEGFESKVIEYNKQKSDYQYVELLNELRDRISKVEEKFEEDKKERTENELEKAKQELAKSQAELEKKQAEVNNLKEQNKQHENEKLLEELSKKNETQDSTIKINIERVEFNEAFNSLPEKQKKYFNLLRDYALQQPQARVKLNKFNLSVGVGNNSYIKFTIKRNTLFAYFGTTEIKLEDDNSFENAKHQIDVMVEEVRKLKNK